MQYNTTREPLIIPEYGRHVQQMVNHCKTLENREDRNNFATAIIDVMGNLNPHLRDVNDFQHKLWDQLFIMASFDLDVDSPYPIPSESDFDRTPNRIEYPNYNNKYRYYGKNIQRMIDVAVQWEKGPKRDGLIQSIANQMKKSYLLWNKDNVEDEVIIEQLRDMSKGLIDIQQMEENIQLSSSKELTAGSPEQARTYYKKNKRKKRRN
ncbi:MAG: DUF4290 domain-containing protein [Flavobacteriaceae bacterium]|nr:DUF4290 domain-containing protein [Flavobacteriaceae bacterium]